MSVPFFYRDSTQPLGSAGLRIWLYASRVLPVMIDAVNEDAARLKAMGEPALPDLPAPFKAASIYRDDVRVDDSVYIEDGETLLLLFEWCDFLSSHRLSQFSYFSYFDDLVSKLKVWTAPIEALIPGSR